MSLNNNPIFLTQKRLVHRGGVLVAILIAALVGLSFFSGLIAYLAKPLDFSSFHSPQDVGEVFYGWTIAVEILILVIGGAARISNVLGSERKAGLWDSNRLTPLAPSRLITGYWFGAPLREFYMAVILAGTGLLIVIFGKLPVTLWLGTQILIFSTALFFGLLAVLFGLVLQRPQGGILFVLLLFIVQLPSAVLPKFFLTAFLLPSYGIINLFMESDPPNNMQSNLNWLGSPEIFGLPIPAILLSLGLQAIIGFFLWRVAVRKTANPYQAPLLRWEALALFAILIVCQQGLVWGQWRGHFPQIAASRPPYAVDADTPLLSIVHVGMLFLAAIILGLFSPQPETVRLKTLRLGIKDPNTIFTQSSVGLALLLAIIVAVVLLAQFALSLGSSSGLYLIAVFNFLDFCLIFSLLLEFCRLVYRRRALGFIVLWLFIFCLLPFIIALIFRNSTLAELSLLSPGCIALNPDPYGVDSLDLHVSLGVTVGYSLVAFIFFLGWHREWKKLLAHAV